MFEKKQLPISAEGDDLSILSLLRPPDSGAWEEQDSEGQLVLDVAQTDDELVIIATMAGTEPGDIELHLHNDLLTIRGWRRDPSPAGSEHFCRECYWGKFSRTIVLPVDVKAELTKAEYKNGVLTVRLPKAGAKREIPILVIGE
ncbi:Hsp20/alpha crystallin family protein [Patescibacteria group bacterium]|nr:MAG: Hsp20/alpha crystallin family protein [Patescibacteria group bacterium]